LSAKQDRQGARTASDLISRYKFGQSFAEAIGIAKDAQDDAQNAQEAVEELNKELDHDEIFARLTKDGTLQGLYRGDDGELYVNATYIKSGQFLADLIKAGVLQSNDGKTFYLDLDKGILKMQATEFLLSGQTVGKIAEEAASSAVDGQTQHDIYLKLTDGEKLKGLYMKNGELYVNATYIESGELLADLIKAGKLSSKDGTTYFDLDNNILTTKGNTGTEDVYTALSAGELCSYFSNSNGTKIPRFFISTLSQLTEIISNGGLNLFGVEHTHLGDHGSPTRIYGWNVVLDGFQLMLQGKYVKWMPNGDGTYSLIGTDSPIED
jgi:hypothetical protein